MSIYGESSNQFRTRPAAVVVLAFSLLSTLIGVALGPLLFSTARTIAARTLRSDYVFNVHAPIGSNPSLGLYPIHSDEIVISASIAAAVIAVLTTLLVAVYPASQKLANRFALYSIGTALLASGAIATVADLGVVRSISRWKELSEHASMSAIGVWILVVLCAVVWLERRTISLLGNVYEIDNPVKRLGLWLLRVPIPWACFGALSYAGDWWGGVIASAGVIVATLVEDLVHYPNLRYESLEKPKMYEGLAAVVLAGVFLCGASLWAFGNTVVGLAPRAIVWDGERLSRELVSDLTTRIQNETMPHIEMRWSNEKKR